MSQEQFWVGRLVQTYDYHETDPLYNKRGTIRRDHNDRHYLPGIEQPWNPYASPEERGDVVHVVFDEPLCLGSGKGATLVNSFWIPVRNLKSISD